MMLNEILSRYNHLRKKKYFDVSLFKSIKKYAFVGVGNHSLTNFYPILRHFGVSLKCICTQRSSWKEEMSQLFPGCAFTHSVEDLLSDPEIEAVFVCASPDQHFSIISRLLSAGKKIFVEKPPCFTLAELELLVNKSADAVCKVGLQRRYWPGNKAIRKRIQSAKSYMYTFHFGPYPSGDAYTELFMHALDYCVFLFGECRIRSFSKSIDDQGETIQAHVSHNKTSGLLQLSTQYSWNDPLDLLTVNCSLEELRIQYPALVEGQQKPKRLLNIPSERLMHQPVVKKQYFSTNNLLIPALDLNTLVLQGFYDEIESFVRLVETGAASGQTKNDLPGLRNVYEIIEELRKK